MATTAVLREALRYISQTAGVRLQIKVQGPELDGMIDGLEGMPWRSSYLLRLPSKSQAAYCISNGEHRASIKRALNKARNSGVYVRPAESEAELEVWYQLYLETMRRVVVPPRPYRFFVALWELLKPRGMMQLLLAEQATMPRGRVIAGSVFLMFGQTVSYAFGASRTKDLSLRPNDMIQWHAIHEACRRGFRFIDFGEVPEGCDDLARFKKKWGSESVRLHRYYYPTPRELNSGFVESGGHPDLLIRAIWRRLPLIATSWLGDWIYARL
jgi:hypothetical protein